MPAGLLPVSRSRSVDEAVETIRQADALRKSVFLASGSAPADRYVALQGFRDIRRRASLDAVEVPFAVRGDFPKDEWKTLGELRVAPDWLCTGRGGWPLRRYQSGGWPTG